MSDLEDSYKAEDIQALMQKLSSWKDITLEIIDQETTDVGRYLYQFNRRWGAPIRSLNYKAELTKRLENARKDLTALLKYAKEKETPEPRDLNEDVWNLMHPVIEEFSRDHMATGHYQEAVESAYDALISGIPTRFKESFSTLVLDTPRADISREEAFRQLVLFSVMMYKANDHRFTIQDNNLNTK